MIFTFNWIVQKQKSCYHPIPFMVLWMASKLMFWGETLTSHNWWMMNCSPCIVTICKQSLQSYRLLWKIRLQINPFPVCLRCLLYVILHSMHFRHAKQTCIYKKQKAMTSVAWATFRTLASFNLIDVLHWSNWSIVYRLWPL